MIVRLDQNAKLAKWEVLHEFQMYTLHEYIMIVLHFDGTNIISVQIHGMIPLLRLKTPGKDQSLLAQVYDLAISVVKRSTHGYLPIGCSRIYLYTYNH